MHFVLKHWHPMVGMDYHIPWPPGSPAPAPAAVPYYTAYLLIGMFPTVFSKPIPSHITDGFAITMAQGTDIGSLIPHIGVPSVTLPVEMAFSFSKSYWGSSRYVAEEQIMACALLVSVNPNLNCGTPLPTPTGFVIAITTHIVEMSLADYLTGFFRMGLDFALQWILSKAGGWIGDKLSGAISQRMANRAFNNVMFRELMEGTSDHIATALALDAAMKAIQKTYQTMGPVVGFILGGPLGADAGTFKIPTLGGYVAGLLTGDDDGETADEKKGLAGRAAESAADFISPSPGVEDYNNGPGAPPVLN